MELLPFLHFFSFILYLYLAVFILIKNPKSLLNRVCCAFFCCFAIWNFGDIFTHSTYISKKSAQFLTNINCIGWTSFSSLFLWFTVIFVGKKNFFKTRLFHFFLFIPPLFFIIAQWNGLLINNWEQQLWGWASIWSDNNLNYLFYLYYLSFMLVSLYFLINFIRKTKSAYKKIQAKVIFFSTAIPLILGTLTDVVLPRLNTHDFPDLANVFTLIWAAGIVIAMIRFGFFTPTPAMAADNIISTMTDALILLDPGGTIVKVNNATLNLLGYNKDELEGNKLDVIFSDTDFKVNKLDKVIKGEEIVKNADLFLKTKEEDHIPVNFSTSVLSEEGAFAGCVCIAQDITDRVKAQEVLKRSRDELDVSVKLKTKE